MSYSWTSRILLLLLPRLPDSCKIYPFEEPCYQGGMPGATNLKESEVLETIVKKQASAGRLYAAVCASPAVALGSWGLLKGLKATCYPSFMEQLAPACAATVESRVQQDGKVVTSRGPGTTMEFSVALVEQLYGKERVDEVSGPLILCQCKCRRDGSFMIIDILRRAKGKCVSCIKILASRQIKLVADVLIDEAAKLSYDLIVLPGGLGGAQAFANSEKLVNMLKKQKESNRPYGAICASPALVLEPHGLLKGKKAAAFPAMCNKLSDQSEIENRVVVDGNLITSRGPGTSMEFALAIVEKFFGRNKALELAKIMLFTRA
ncbi:hypothetical protein CUMW_248930 [Citrus unshiu]|nr:hypothetical protein CUMW_248930 [Citrus unshiu]